MKITNRGYMNKMTKMTQSVGCNQLGRCKYLYYGNKSKKLWQ